MIRQLNARNAFTACLLLILSVLPQAHASTLDGETLCVDLSSGEFLETDGDATAKVKCGCTAPRVAEDCTASFTSGNCRYHPQLRKCQGECTYTVLCPETADDFEATKDCTELTRPAHSYPQGLCMGLIELN